MLTTTNTINHALAAAKVVTVTVRITIITVLLSTTRMMTSSPSLLFTKVAKG